MYRILGTRDYLKKVKIKESNECSLCGLYEENVEHLFCKCKEATQLWENVEQWINNKLGLQILTNHMKYLGYFIYRYDQNFWPLNLVLMTTRKYIFWCSKNGFKLNIYFLQKEVKKIYMEQETLSQIN